jgi:sugar lactone lactonase YvrE
MVNVTTGIILTVAGNGSYGYGGDGGPATSAELKLPQGVVLDSSGNVYIGDASNFRIRMVNTNTGYISTVAGNGSWGYGGDGGPPTSAQMDPSGIAFDSTGNMYIADASNNRIRMVI